MKVELKFRMELTPHYAGFWVRVWAFFLDYLLIGIVFIVPGWTSGEADWYEAHGTIALVLAWLYFALFESSKLQATPGKRFLHLRIVDMEGNRISFVRAAARNLAKYFSFALLLVGVLMVPFTRRKQGLHDLVAQTVVVWG